MNDKQWEQLFAKLAQNSGMHTLPTEKREALTQAFEKQQQNRPTFLERIVAALSFDSFSQPLPQGARKANLAETRQLFYHCPLGDIALDLSEVSGKYLLNGQLFFTGLRTEFDVTVAQAETVVGDTLTNPRGAFRLFVPLGRARITFANPDHTIVLNYVPLELARES